MNKKQKLTFSRRDYTEKQLYKDLVRKKKKEGIQDIYNDSEVGGESQNQRNPWQGSQNQWQQL